MDIQAIVEVWHLNLEKIRGLGGKKSTAILFSLKLKFNSSLNFQDFKYFNYENILYKVYLACASEGMLVAETLSIKEVEGLVVNMLNNFVD